MEWVERHYSRTTRAPALAELARLAAERNPDSPWSILAQANTAFSIRDYEKATKLFETAASMGIERDLDWHKLVRCYLEIGQPENALKACDRCFAVVDEPGYELRMQAGLTHLLLRNAKEARHHLMAAADLGNVNEACWHILREPARANDTAGIFALCDDLEARFGTSCVFTANRALAHSMVGDERNAARLVDLDKHVRVGTIDEFFTGDLSAFNAALACEAIEIADGNGSPETTIVPSPDISDYPAVQALQAIVRTAIEAYLDEAEERGLESCLPFPMEKASISTGTTLLRRDGCNGQHIHVTSVISAVYHIKNPAEDAHQTGAGALQIGPADQYAGGHVACWGERRVLPQPGQLTIFPAHFFHDVIPTGSDELRISFPSDVHLVD